MKKVKEAKKKVPEKPTSDKNNTVLKIGLEDLKNCKSPSEFVCLVKTNCCGNVEKIELTLQELRKIKAGFVSTKPHCNTEEGSNKVFRVCKRCNIVQKDNEKPLEEVVCFVCGDNNTCSLYSSSIQDITLSYDSFLNGCLYASGFAFKTQMFDDLLEESNQDTKKPKKMKATKDSIEDVSWGYITSSVSTRKNENTKKTPLALCVVPIENGRWSPKKSKYPVFGLERL